jgi:hypothetical protein
MAGYTVAKIDDIEGAYGGAFKRVRAALGASAFGMQIVEMPPNVDGYPEHDHATDGQEEIYVTLSGDAVMTVAGDEVTLDRETLVRVGPGVMRKIVPGDDGLRVLIVGGVPGKVYEAPAMTELEGSVSA